jgi:dihydropteroate synthase
MNPIPFLKGPLGKIPITQPVVMGILNITPDSFYAGSRFSNNSHCLLVAEKMLQEGALILDIGGQSSRPGSERLSAEEEWQRVFPALEAIKKEFPKALVSIDTYHAEVAKKAINLGADIINDISFGEDDDNMFTTLANQNITYIGMHKIGDPKTMQNNAEYADVTHNVMQYLQQKVLEAQKIGLNNVWVDPGFGFAKTPEQNFQLLRELNQISFWNPSILVGISRKSMIYKTLDISADDALNGTSFLHAEALKNGAKILRVHDVKSAVECITLWQNLYP